MAVGVVVQGLDCKFASGREPLPDFVLKAYVLSLIFLVVVLYVTVGDAAEILVHSFSAYASRYTHYNLDIAFSHF